MPTFTNNPQQGFTKPNRKPQFPRNPKPGENIHPDSRLAMPHNEEAFKGPHPFLTSHGFNGDIQSFNRRVKLAHDGYSNAYKQEPSPGVVWDVAMSPSLEDSQIPAMFQVPLDQRDTKAQKYHLEAQHDGNGVHVREDGKVQPTNLLTAWRHLNAANDIAVSGGHSVKDAGKNAPLPLNEFHKRYPILMDGFTGMLPMGNTFWKDVGESGSNPAHFTQKLGYLTPDQALKVASQAQDSQIAQQGQAAQFLNYQTQSKLGSKEVKGSLPGDVKANTQKAVSRNKVRQEWLLKHDPSGLFRGLQPSGIFDRQWMTAYDQWSRTPGAAYLALKSVAQQNYFTPTPAGIKAMTEAAKTKERMANAANKWSEKWQIEATPLRFFSKSSAPGLSTSVLKPGEDWKLMNNFWKYEDTGTSHLWPVAALQSGFRFAKLGFDTMSGGFNQVTGDANGFTTTIGNMLTGVDQGKSTKQIAADFHRAVEENPSWVNVLGFGKIPAKDTNAWWDQAGNFVIGTALAMMMSGPGYWKAGEDTPLAALQGNRFLKVVTKLAHSDIKAGDLVRAENILGPRDADTFIAAVEKDVRSGALKHEDFHNLVSKYAHDGKVTYGEGVKPRVFSTAEPDYMTPITRYQGFSKESFKGLYESAPNDGHHFYHATSEENLSSVREHGLTIGKAKSRKAGTGVYLAEDGTDVSSLRPGRARGGDVLFRVKRNAVNASRTDMYPADHPEQEWLSKETIPSKDLEYLGSDNQWHPVDSSGPGKTFGTKPNEGILPQLHSDKLPKSFTKANLQTVGRSLRRRMDDLELQALAHGGPFGKVTEAFVRQTRGMFGLASPDNKLVDLFGPKVPNQLESYLTNHGLADRAEITDMANKFIRARAHENIPEMEAILKDANARYRAKFPKGRSFGEASDFEKLLETENLTHFRFAGGGLRGGDDIWGKTENVLNHINQGFNTVGHYWRRTILATGPGLFYKHLVRDSVAALMGGMKIGQPTEDMLNAAKVFEQVAKENPELRRLHAATRGSVAGADLSYMLGHNYSAVGSFKLMDEIAQNGKASTELSLKAATHLRRMVMSKMYGPFREALETGNMDPMVRVVMEDKNFRALLHENTDISKQIENIRSYGEKADKAGDYGIESQALRNMMERQLVHKEASAYAKAVFDEYKSVVDEGKAQHIPDVLDTVDTAHWDNPGLADKKVAKFLRENEINIEVKGGAPKPKDWFDKSTGALVSTYMKPNKFFRGQLFDDAFARNYANMLAMGYDAKASAGMAVRLAEHQTMYHMLDFSNTLQFEQKFRGFLPFFTKHRLFVKWVASRIAQYPGIVMPASDISKHLDQYGRLNFNFMGTPMNINVTRLMWLNSEDLPVIIPGAQFIPKAGLPGEFTRFDSVIGMWFHAVQSNYNYSAVVKHMDPYSVMRLDKYMAIFAIHYRMAHGESAPVPESEALKYAMIRGGGGGVTGNLLVNNSFLSPATFSEPQTPGPIHKLDLQFSKLFNQNPAKARAFLDKHPEAGLGWGLTENFDLYNHVTQYWGLYDKIHSEYMKVEKHFSDQVLAGKPMSAADYEKVHLAQTRYDQGIQHLLLQDARQWKTNAGGYAPGQVSGAGEITNYGPWGTLFLHDPIGSANRLIQQFGGRKAFSTADLHNIYGEYSQMLQYNIDHAKALGLDSASVNELYAKLKRVEGTYKLTGTPTLWQTYKQAYDKYQGQLATFRNKASKATGYQKTVIEYEERQFIVDHLERPYIKYDGKQVQVLPFSQYYIGTRTPAEQTTAIWKDMVGFTSYSRLTYDERQQLGLATTPNIDKAWSTFNSWVAEYTQQTGKEASTSVRQALATQLNRDYPGFWHDYLIAHQPKAVVLQYYAKGAFTGPYAEYWKEIVAAAVRVYRTNKHAWPAVAQQINSQVENEWPQGFVKQYNAAGGASLLSSLLTAWG